MSSFVTRVFNWLRNQDQGYNFAENRDMLHQFYATLKVVLDSCRPEDPDHNPEMAASVDTILKEDPATRRWMDAYQAELYLALIRPRTTLRDELTAALAGLKRARQTATTVYDADVQELVKLDLTQDKDAPRARALLFRVLTDRHWHAARRNLTRQIGLRYAGRLFSAIVLTLLLFGFTITMTALLGASFDRIGWSYTGFSIAGATGFVGAVFSMMTSHRDRHGASSIEEAHLMARRRTIALRIAIGGTAAVALYFMFETGLVSGEAFPKLDQLGFRKIALSSETNLRLGVWVPTADLCKFIVWSFLAGFSEKLVPKLLSRAESKETAEKS